MPSLRSPTPWLALFSVQSSSIPDIETVPCGVMQQERGKTFLLFALLQSLIQKHTLYSCAPFPLHLRITLCNCCPVLSCPVLLLFPWNDHCCHTAALHHRQQLPSLICANNLQSCSLRRLVSGPAGHTNPVLCFDLLATFPRHLQLRFLVSTLRLQPSVNA
jgi:hypothetical protein